MGYEYIKGYSHYGSYDGLASVWGFGDDGKTDALPNVPPPQKIPMPEQKEIAVMPPIPKSGVEVPTPVEQAPPELPPEQLPDTDPSTERLRQQVIEKTTREGIPQQYMYDPKTGQALVYDDKTGKYHPLQTFYPSIQFKFIFLRKLKKTIVKYCYEIITICQSSRSHL